jgi:hypothetical protein
MIRRAERPLSLDRANTEKNGSWLSGPFLENVAAQFAGRRIFLRRRERERATDRLLDHLDTTQHEGK